jgi:hypothetical protein
MDTVRLLKSDTEHDQKDGSDDSKFNAAQYLYVSTKLAEEYSKLKESQIILKFSTPWPLHSYSKTLSVCKTYSKKYSFLKNSFAIILIYLMKALMHIPPSVQDMLYQFISLSGIGYAMVLLVKLYRINEFLPFVAVFLVIVILFLLTRRSKSDKFSKLGAVSPIAQTNKETQSQKQSETILAQSVEPSQPVSQSSTVAHQTRRQSVMAGLAIVDELNNNNNISNTGALNKLCLLDEDNCHSSNESDELNDDNLVDMDDNSDFSTEINDDINRNNNNNNNDNNNNCNINNCNESDDSNDIIVSESSVSSFIDMVSSDENISDSCSSCSDNEIESYMRHATHTLCDDGSEDVM